MEKKPIDALAPMLTLQNERVSRVRELEELYAALHAATGFTAEQLLGMFAEGYTLEKPDHSKHFETMANLAERIQRAGKRRLPRLRGEDGRERMKSEREEDRRCVQAGGGNQDAESRGEDVCRDRGRAV